MSRNHPDIIARDDFTWPDSLPILGQIVSIGGAISLFCSSAMLIDIMRNRNNFHTFASRYIIFLALTDILFSISAALGRFPININNWGLCVAQSMLTQASVMSNLSWATAMQMSLMGSMYFRKNINRSKKAQMLIYFVCIALPLLSAVVPSLVVNDFWGDSTFWCWIEPKYGPWRMYIYYIPVLAMLSLNTVLTLFIGKRLYRTYRELRAIPGRHDTLPLNPSSDPNLAADTSGSKNELGVAESASVAVRPGNVVTAAMSKKTAGKKARMNYGIRSTLYLLAVMITWVPAGVNRLAALMGSHVITLVYLQAIFSPLQGLWNALIYFMSRYRRSRKTYRRQFNVGYVTASLPNMRVLPPTTTTNSTSDSISLSYHRHPHQHPQSSPWYPQVASSGAPIGAARRPNDAYSSSRPALSSFGCRRRPWWQRWWKSSLTSLGGRWANSSDVSVVSRQDARSRMRKKAILQTL